MHLWKNILRFWDLAQKSPNLSENMHLRAFSIILWRKNVEKNWGRNCLWRKNDFVRYGWLQRG